jgi:hypothetical protein
MRLFTASILALFALVCGNRAFADSFRHYPDSVTFTPSSGQTSMTMNVYAFYNGDTANGPGTTVHARISSGSSYFRVDTTAHHFKNYYYWTITYTVQSSAVTGYVTLSDDTNSQQIKLLGGAGSNGEITGYGPYFSSTKMDSSSCTTLRLINSGSHRDTIIAAGWTHNPNGVFTWDTTKVGTTIGSHDTAYWTFCFYAPHDTLYHIDTFNIAYHDSTGTNKYVTRIVTGKAAGPTPDADLATSTNSYFSTTMDSSTCLTYKLINAGADRDTIASFSWSHNPNGVFTFDSSAIPHVLNSHDTLGVTFCFHAPHDTLYHIDTLTIYYRDAMSATRSITRVFYARATHSTSSSSDAEISAYGPYFTGTDEGHTNCANLRLINAGSDNDTISSISWSHNPNGLFTYDTTVSLPYVLRSHDTLMWQFCFHAPNDTNLHADTITVNYRDAYSSSRSITRLVYGKAVDSSLIECYTIYAQSVTRTEVGDTSYVHIYIANRLDSSATLTAMHLSGSGDAAYRIDSSTFPHTIAGHHYDSVWVAFIPYAGASSFSATLTGSFTVNDTVHCKSASASLSGTAAYAAHDTSGVNFNDTGRATVNMSGDSGHIIHRVDFYNTSSVNLLVHSITLSNTSHFYLAQVLPGTPDTVRPGGKISALIYFYADSSGTTYHDTIIVQVEHGLESFYVYLSGHSTGAVSEVRADAAPHLLMSIRPNPSFGMTSIELAGAQQVHYEIIDLLGSVVATHDGLALWQWNAADLPSGVYYVRAQAENATETRRIVISH